MRFHVHLSFRTGHGIQVWLVKGIPGILAGIVRKRHSHLGLLNWWSSILEVPMTTLPSKWRNYMKMKLNTEEEELNHEERHVFDETI